MRTLTRGEREILVFEAPEHDGLQVPNGIVDPDETAREALFALRPDAPAGVVTVRPTATRRSSSVAAAASSSVAAAASSRRVTDFGASGERAGATRRRDG